MGRIFPFLTKFCSRAEQGASILALSVALVLLPDASSVLLARVDVSWTIARAYAQSGEVYRFRDRDGRNVYTNLEGMASHGAALTRVKLPPLSSIDFERAKPEELRKIDAQVRESHEELQAGELCEAIRKSSRSAQRSRLWEDHGRKISVAGGLLVFAALLGFLGAGRKLGALWPLPPLAGCIFLGYATWRDVQSAREALTAGLRACSEELPEGEADDKSAVQGRLSRALDLQNIINQSYARQTAEIDAIMRER
jgi:hypothetical protein